MTPARPRPRPDLLDGFVQLWLSTAVGMAALATAPLNAFRSAWPEPASAGVPGEVDACPFEGWEPPDDTPACVSPVRPSDLMPPPEAGLAATETCGNCRHFHRANAQAGECRYDAPIQGESGTYAEWPITTEGEWCGRFFKAHVPGLTREDLDALH